MNRIKIAVYTIALNEEKFVECWFNSISSADYILIADTGSHDKSIQIAKSLGIEVFNLKLVPFRFDGARNAATSHILKNIDYCIALDLDEVVIGDLHEAFRNVPREVTRLKYPFVQRWNPEGTAARTHITSKIHARSG